MSTSLHYYAVLFVACLLLAGCSKPGYEKVNGKWAWVSSNPAVGRIVIELDADESSFQVLDDDRYAQDKTHVYFEDKLILDAQPDSFEILPDQFEDKGRLFARDATHVFLNGQTIFGADPQTYSVVRGPFGKDTQRFYNGTVPLEGVDVKSFQVIRGNMRLSGQHNQEYFVLNYGDEFQDFEVSNDRPVLSSGGVWWKDARNHYYDINRIDDADYATFKVIDNFNAVDKNHQYRFGFRKDEFERRQAEHMQRQQQIP